MSRRNKPDKPNTTQVTIIEKKQENIIKLVDNNTGKLVPTKEDRQAVEEAKEALRVARQKRLESQEAMRLAKQKIEALNRREAIKALKQELKDKIEAKLAEVNKIQASYKIATEEYNSLLTEYEDLTDISKKALEANDRSGKGSPRLTGRSNWDPVVTEVDKGIIKVIVKHKLTNNLFEYSLIAGEDNGMIPYNSWIDLRHAFYINDGTDKPKAVFYDYYQSLDDRGKANLRAFLYPRLYTLISNVRAIADKV